MAEQILHNPPIHDIFTFILCLGQITGAFPLRFVENVEACSVKFRWMHYKTFYSIFHIFLLIMMTFFCACGAQMAYISWTFRHIVRTLFYATSLWGAISLFVVVKKWPELVDKWIELDKSMAHNYGFPKNMNKRAKIMALITTIYATGQILIFVLYNVENTRKLARAQNVPFGHSIYFKTVFAQVFNAIPYSLILGLLCQFVFFLSIWRFAYSDLFISLISSFLSIRLQQITERVKFAAKKRRTIAFWREIREDYDRVCVLCKEADDAMSNIIFVTYTTNLVLLLVYLRNCTIIEGLVQLIQHF
ncbi:gustatory receptor for sugar taste 64e-like [Photinus pyralis]|uniref:gustatory receptor for sugar taste 64e-like n=1 Tax=Photinus pyralis TaxID=7054 RepID=UPI0012675D6A|nr:gustatory receptor for sugar taste 64e-like [Photinus pyralis]